MTTIKGRAIDAAAAALRPMWDIKGVHRLAKLANTALTGNRGDAVRVAKLHDGSRILVDLWSTSQWHAFYSGKYDDLWVELSSDLLDDQSLYLDVGANIGIYAIRVALKHKVAGQCHCFEPLPSNVERLSENVTLNGCQDQIIVYPFGLSDSDAVLPLLLREDFEMGSGTGNASIQISADADASFKRIDIAVRRLDDHLAILGDKRVGVVKVDVEGHEDQFFRGGQMMLARDRPIIIAELCRSYLVQKGVTAEQVYVDCLPPGYVLFRERRDAKVKPGARSVDRLIRAASFAEIGELENILLCPEEKVGLLG